MGQLMAVIDNHAQYRWKLPNKIHFGTIIEASIWDLEKMPFVES